MKIHKLKIKFMYKKIILPNGLRLILVPNQNTKAVTVMILVGAGSKYETKNTNGVSHFLEHLLFKGTKKRPTALKISETLDKVGGIYNAFTSKELTGYFAKVDASHWALAFDWVSDIFLHSVLPSKEIERERGVILEEINMMLDTPMRYIGELWERLLYGDQPAGWDIIGTKENILRLQRKNFIDYLKGHYSSHNTVVAVAGNFPVGRIEEEVRKSFRGINKAVPAKKVKTKEQQTEPRILVHHKQTDQTHLCLGVRALNTFHPKKYVQEILAVILGGNMSSRLFTEVREKRGLAYYIHTSAEDYADSGFLMTQAGVPNQKAAQAIKVILKEYQKIKERGVSIAELQKAKDYLKGVLVLSLEASDAQAMFFAGQELLENKILTLEEKCAKIDKVRVGDIKQLAVEIFQPAKLNLAILGPHEEKENFEKLLRAGCKAIS